MVATTYVSLDVALTITTTLKPGNPPDSLHSTALLILTSIWPGTCVSLTSITLYMTSDVTLQRGVSLLCLDDMDRGQKTPRATSFSVLYVGRHPFYSRATLIFPSFSSHLQWYERQDRWFLHRDGSGDCNRYRALPCLARYYRRFVHLPSCL